MSEDNHQTDDFDAPVSSQKPKKRVLTIKKTLVYIGIIVVAIIMTFTVIMAKLINENSQCTSNPFIYGAQRIESSRGEANPFCSCTIEEDTFCACAMANKGAFWFDQDRIYSKNPLFNPNSGREMKFTSP